MGYTLKKLEDMDVMDDFLMGQLASDEVYGTDFCRIIISTLLQKKIGRLRVSTQKVIHSLAPHLRGIRMDVEVEELGDVEDSEEPAVMNIYDMEPHLQKNMDLPRHNRFYQAKIDSKGLKSGEKYFTKLPNLYIITILNFDPFGRDRMVYTVRNKCEEDPDLVYEDGLKFCYFYTGGTQGGNVALKAMLTYMQDSREENVTDEATAELHSYVSRAKVMPEVKNAYMTLDELIYYANMEEREEATIDTMVQDIQDLLEDYGDIPERVVKRLKEAKDRATLKRWHKLAAKSNSIEEFEAAMYLDFIPGMTESILEGANELIEDCIQESMIEW